MAPRTVRIVEIAELLGVSKQRAHQLAAERDFPAPVTEDIADDCGIGARSRPGRRFGGTRSRGVA
jgi:hypothetical protein